ncbi:HDOD domain-containing protein [Roseateles sp. DB2]|uniref:HDOD domain-containing protein n=1 Tax=Roseateles sp. DB2 TaxID=3453717 RepID=UPI003EEE386D
MTAADAAEMVRRIRDLPTPNAVAMTLLSSLADEGLSIEQLTKTISLDQGIVAKVLRLANSPFYGLARRVTLIPDAVSIIGWRSVRNLALAAGLARGFDLGRCPCFDLGAYWRHSLACALCAEALARARGEDGGLAFGGGLLHDLGRVVLACVAPDDYAKMLRWRADTGACLFDAEQSFLGLDHVVIGGMLAEQWLLAPALVDSVALHHQPPEDGSAPLADLVHVADCVAHGLGLEGAVDESVPPLALHSWRRLDMAEPQWFNLFAGVESEHAALCQAFFPGEGTS